MNNYMGNVPSLKNSNAVGQSEIQKARQKMGNYGGTMGQSFTSGMTTGAGNMTTGTANMTTGAGTNLSSSTSIGQYEIKEAREKVQNSGFQNTTYNTLS
ncbi:hypothetical protein QBE52_06720 [Clostridiaceae bacterium 35-E11]